MSGNFKHMRHYTEANKSKVFVLGPGPSCLQKNNIELLQKISKTDIPIFTFQKTFPYCLEYFNITPDYWSFYDPNASLPGLQYICNNPDIKTKVVLPSIADMRTPTDFRKYCPKDGTTALEYKKKDWDLYKKLLQNAKQRSQTTKVESDTIFRIYKEDREVFKDLSQDLMHPIRLNKIFFGTSINFKLKNIGAENKFSLAVLPILRYLGFKEVYTIGFDGLPGRFYQEKEPDDSRTKSYVSEYRYLDQWLSSSEKIGMKIFTVNPGCNIKRYGGLEYKSPLGETK